MKAAPSVLELALAAPPIPPVNLIAFLLIDNLVGSLA